MKKVFLFLALFASVLFAQGNKNAIGLWLGSYGNNWGIDFKQVNNKNAWAIYLDDFRFGDESVIGLSGAYYFVHNNVIKADASAGRFPLYWGPSVGFGYWSGGNKPHRYNGIDVGLNLVGGLSWVLPVSFKMDISLELLTPGLGHWHEERENDEGKWHTNNSPAFGLKGSLGFRLLFHAYLF